MARNYPLKTLTKAASVKKQEPRLSRILGKWPLWGLGTFFVTVLLGGASIFSLITQPPKPNCDTVFWPFAPASVRLYCAQELAQEPSLENLLKAIELVDGLGEDHPLRGAINPRIEVWSKMALDRAEASFHAGNLKRAIQFAEKIPAKTAAAKLVRERIEKWRKIWAEGETINTKVEAAFEEENWRKAFGEMVDLLYVENRYWSQTRYDEITDTIIQAQKDEKNVVEAEKLIKSSNFDDLEKAMKLVRSLPGSTIFTKSVAKIFDTVAAKFIAIAEQALNRENLNRAMDALSLIPRESQYWEQSKALSTIANASALTWSVSSDGYQRAIDELAAIPEDNPLYGRAQALMRRWQGEIGYVKVLEKAQLTALNGDLSALKAAIASARSIPRGSEQWDQAQNNISDWASRVQRVEDQPILDYANELSLNGDVASLQTAIAQAQKIRPGRALHAEAQSQIDYWRSRIEDLTYVASYPQPSQNSTFTPSEPFPDSEPQSVAVNDAPLGNQAPVQSSLIADAQALARKGTPEQLVSAMNTANQVPLNSADRYEAELEIDNWANQLLQMASFKAQENPQQAIALAQQIPSFSQVYRQAQQKIAEWQANASSTSELLNP